VHNVAYDENAMRVMMRFCRGRQLFIELLLR
jgi:hypothetical protein